MLAAEIMDLLDGTVVNVAGPSLKKSLSASSTQLQWVIGIYTLAMGIGVITGGRMGDRYGRRNLFLIGLSGFTIASLACSTAPTIHWLIFIRLIQGLFGAILLPQGFGLIRAAFPPQETGQAFSVFGPVFGLSAILGPIIGGGIISGNFFNQGWRCVFLINIPIGIVAAILAYKILPELKHNHEIKIDIVGTLIIGTGSALLIWPLIQGRTEGWPTWTWLSMVTSLLIFALFVLQQNFSVKRGGTPLVLPSLLKKPSYTFGLGGLFLFFAGSTGTQLILSLFLQLGEHYGTGRTGLSNIPITIGSACGAALSGAVLADKLGRKALQIGGVIQIVGAGILWFGLNAHSGFAFWHLVPGMVVAGFGSGICVAALFNVILGSVDNHEVGSASGFLSSIQSIGASVGVAIYGSYFFDALTKGSAINGYKDAIYLQFVVLIAFLILSPKFPLKARE